MAIILTKKVRFRLEGILAPKIVEKQAAVWAKEYDATAITIIRDNGTPSPNDESWIVELDLPAGD